MIKRIIDSTFIPSIIKGLEKTEIRISNYDDILLVNVARLKLNHILPISLTTRFPMVGEHAICGGIITFHQSSDSWDVLLCSKCGLRIMVPNSIKTFGDLEKHFKDRMSDFEMEYEME